MIVPAAANMVADNAAGRLVDFGHLLSGKTVAAQQPVDWICVLGRQELASWVGPAILFGAGHVDRPGSHQGNQLVLINR